MGVKVDELADFLGLAAPAATMESVPKGAKQFGGKGTEKEAPGDKTSDSADVDAMIGDLADLSDGDISKLDNALDEEMDKRGITDPGESK